MAKNLAKNLNQPFHVRWQILLGGWIVSSVTLIALSGIAHDQVISRNATVAKSSNIYIKLGRIIRKMSEAETSQRGYLLTQETDYLRPYNKALPELKAILDELNEHYSQGEAADPRFAAMQGNIQRKLAGMDLTISLGQQNKWSDAVSVVKTGLGKAQMEEAIALIDKMRQEQQEIIDANVLHVQESIQTSRLMTIALAALNLGLLLWVIIRQRRAARLAAERESLLDDSIAERTEQLAQLATYLQEISEDEKTRMGRELHDELGGLLTATKMDLSWAISKILSDPDAAGEKLTRAIKNLDQGIQIKRRIIEGLRPTTLASFGLVTAARELVEQLADSTNWSVSLELPEEDPDLPEEAEIALFRILQESLTNAAKYAQASHVRISLMCMLDHCKLEVEDNGIGFRTRDIRPKAAGLMGMRERLRARGGKVDIETGQGQGTLIRALLPLNPTMSDLPELQNA